MIFVDKLGKVWSPGAGSDAMCLEAGAVWRRRGAWRGLSCCWWWQGARLLAARLLHTRRDTPDPELANMLETGDWDEAAGDDVKGCFCKMEALNALLVS